MCFCDSFNFPPGLNELHCSLLIGGIPLLILATQEDGVWRRVVGGISPDKKEYIRTIVESEKIIKK
jgi:hypothetical protein